MFSLANLIKSRSLALVRLRFNHFPTNRSSRNRLFTSFKVKTHNQDTSDKSVESVASFALLCIGRALGGFSVVYVCTEYGADLVRCEGPSMMPTIQPAGEIILVEKVSFRIYGISGGSKASKRIHDAKQRQLEWVRKSSQSSDLFNIWHEPKQLQATVENYKELSSFSNCINKLNSGISVGDVVVIEHPEREGTICKRVVGLPGDIIIRPDQSIRNFGPREREILSLFDDEENETNSFQSSSAKTSLRNTSFVVVPDGHIWVEGDNSLNSADSRNYGAIPSSLVIGKVWMRVWPLKSHALLVRGARPLPKNRNTPFTGSCVIPAGNEGELQLSAKKFHELKI